MKRIAARAARYSLPVMLGYIAIGVAFGLLASDAGYPWFVALAMSVLIYAGAGQYVAIALFAAGAGLLEIIIVELVVNARHIAYGAAMISRFDIAPRYKPYLIFALTDETFALLSSLDGSGEDFANDEEKSLFMFLVSLFDHFYWIAGSVAGAVIGAVLPFEITGVDYALTALFIVLLIEQITRVKKALPFVIAAACAVAGVLLLNKSVSLLAALALSLVLIRLFEGKKSCAL